MNYLLIARFAMGDIPLRLYGDYSGPTAEADAKAIHADPTLLDTKWKRSLDKWPGRPGGFVGAIVLSINDLDGWPAKVRFDSTTEPVPAPPKPAPPTTTPPEPAHPPIPQGHIEITDPNHRLRSGIDYALDLADPKDGWSKVEKATVGDNSHKFRFCCPAEYHPSHQPAPAPTEPTHPPVPEGYIEITDTDHKLRSHVDFVLSRYITPDEWIPITESDAVRISEWSEPGYRFCCPADKHPDLQCKPAETPTREQLQAVVRSLEQSNSDLRAEFEQWRAHADTRIAELTTENSNLHAQLREQSQSAIKRNESDQQAFEVLRAQNSDLRRLNEDLNNRLSKTLARAALATHLESSVRASGIQMLRFSVAMGDRRRWATTFVEEGVLAKPYLQAIGRIDEQFTELFGEFVARFPHIQPDMPDEWQMGFDNADNAGNADNDNEYDE